MKVFPIDFILFQIDFIARNFARIGRAIPLFQGHKASPIWAIGLADTCIWRRYLSWSFSRSMSPAR